MSEHRDELAEVVLALPSDPEGVPPRIVGASPLSSRQGRTLGNPALPFVAYTAPALAPPHRGEMYQEKEGPSGALGIRNLVNQLAGALMRSPAPDKAFQEAVLMLKAEVHYRADLLLGRFKAQAFVLTTEAAEEARA